MTKKFSSLCIIALASFLLTSCLSDNDDDTTYYDDTAITAFSLGTLSVSHTTKAHDKVTDSTYYTTLTGSYYRFNIDQVNHTIYNTDSLPLGTRVSRVLATITTKNSGMAVLNLTRKDGTDSLTYYSSTDSIDFTNPVRIRVYNMRATAYREYTVTVNVHKQLANSFSWNTLSGQLESVDQRKIVFLGGDTYLFGLENGQTVGYKKNGNTWERLSAQLGSNAYMNMTTFGNYIYTLNGNEIYRSANGSDWSLVSSAEGISRLAGASSTRLYALTSNGIAYSTDGSTWTTDSIDDSSALLPNEDVNFISQTSKLDESVNNLILIGNRDGKTVVWSKVEENDNDADSDPWTYYTDDEYNRKTLPYLQGLTVVPYDGGLLATGGNASVFYASPDMGLTWNTTSTYALPEALAGNGLHPALACDSNSMLYFTFDGSNSVLTGRLARLGWNDPQKVFTE